MARKDVNQAWLRFATVILAAVIGSLLGALLLNVLGWTVALLPLVFIMLVVTALFSGIGALVLRRDLAVPRHRLNHQPQPAPSTQPWEQQQDGQAVSRPHEVNSGPMNQPYSSPYRSPRPDPSHTPNPPDPSRAETFQPMSSPTAPAYAVIAVDLTQSAALAGGPPSGAWWNQTEHSPVAASAEIPPYEAPDISSYVMSGQIVQCTKCAAFAVDVQRVGTGFSFRCHACDHKFNWQRNEEWPAWKVSPQSRLNP
jgi:hypothetical protein